MSQLTGRRLSVEAIRESESDAKIALIATVNPAGLPHLTLITTLQASGPAQITWGQFCEGSSKVHVKSNPCTAFLIMNQKKELWRGTARWTHEAKEGAEYELYNRKPMFRYNSYLGLHTVHYMDLIEASEKEALSVAAIVAGSGLATAGRLLAGPRHQAPVLKPWAEDLINNISTLKFIAYVASDGFPRIVPVVPCQVSAGRRSIFVPTVYRHELDNLSSGMTVALFAINLQMESVLVRGIFVGYRRWLGPRMGIIDINWVYNSMPPKHGQIYPLEPVRPVLSF